MAGPQDFRHWRGIFDRHRGPGDLQPWRDGISCGIRSQLFVAVQQRHFHVSKAICQHGVEHEPHRTRHRVLTD